MIQLPKIITEGCYAVIDLETTGLSNKKDEAVQVAFGLIDNGKTRLRGYYTVRPYVAVSPGAQAVHKFDYSQLAHSPSFSDIAYEFRMLLSGRTILGYNARTFDVPILKRQFAEASIEFDPEVLDVLWWARKLLPGGKHKLTDVLERLQLPVQQAHDAWRDCRMTWSAFAALAVKFPDFGSVLPTEAVKAQESKKP